MKKYRHIKTGLVVTESSNVNENLYVDNFGNKFLIDIVENSADWSDNFWKVTKMVSINHQGSRTNTQGFAPNFVKYFIGKGYKVHTVTNDTDTLSVGDAVQYGDEVKIIDFLEIRDNVSGGLAAYFGKSTDDANTEMWSYDIFKKAKPLYTTEDGVKRCEYQREWWIIKDSENKTWRFVSNIYSKVEQNDLENGKIKEVWKAFSTKEAAEKWMQENNPKPKLTFLTEDKVVLKEGDPYYSVPAGDSYYNRGTVTNYFIKNVRTPMYKIFSTEEKANEYIKRFKKKFSYEDVLQIAARVCKKSEDEVEKVNVIIQELKKSL